MTNNTISYPFDSEDNPNRPYNRTVMSSIRDAPGQFVVIVKAVWEVIKYEWETLKMGPDF